MVPTEYDVERETEFCRQQLATTIPNRLDELLEKVDHSRGYIEDWYADLILKISLSIGRVCNDLFKTTEQDALPAAAWKRGTCWNYGCGRNTVRLLGTRPGTSTRTPFET